MHSSLAAACASAASLAQACLGPVAEELDHAGEGVVHGAGQGRQHANVHHDLRT